MLHMDDDRLYQWILERNGTVLFAEAGYGDDESVLVHSSENVPATRAQLDRLVARGLLMEVEPNNFEPPR